MDTLKPGDVIPPKMLFRYVTLAEIILLNAHRHMKNSGDHAAAGRYEYADGSADKASKNLRKWFLLMQSPFKVLYRSQF